MSTFSSTYSLIMHYNLHCKEDLVSQTRDSPDRGVIAAKKSMLSHKPLRLVLLYKTDKNGLLVVLSDLSNYVSLTGFLNSNLVK